MKISSKKRELLIIGFLLCLSLIWLLFNFLTQKEGSKVTIEMAQETIATFNLNEDRTYLIHGSDSDLLLAITNGKAFIEEAGCKDKLCQKQGTISKSGEKIVCLPNQVIITITGDSQGENPIDGVVR